MNYIPYYAIGFAIVGIVTLIFPYPILQIKKKIPFLFYLVLIIALSITSLVTLVVLFGYGIKYHDFPLKRQLLGTSLLLIPLLFLLVFSASRFLQKKLYKKVSIAIAFFCSITLTLMLYVYSLSLIISLLNGNR